MARTPTPTNDALARAWKNQDFDAVFTGAEALLDAGVLGPHRLDAIMQRLPHHERSALRADLLEQAAACEHLHGGDEDDSVGVELFAIPVHGTGDSLGDLVDDVATRQAIAQAIVTHGMVHGDVLVSVLWGFWTVEDLARMDPQSLRRAAQEAADRMDAGSDAGATPLAALAGSWERPTGEGPQGGVLLAVVIDPGMDEPGVVDPLRYLLNWGDADAIEGPIAHAIADPTAAWFALWEGTAPGAVGTLEPTGMGMAAAAALEARLQETALAQGADPDRVLIYDLQYDDQGGAVVEASIDGTLWARLSIPPRLFDAIGSQILLLFDDETEEADATDEPLDDERETGDKTADPSSTPLFWAGGDGARRHDILDAFRALQPPKNGRTN